MTERNLYQKVLVLVCAILLLCSAAHADGEWFCPQCGRKNDSLFCPVDGTGKPKDLDAAVSAAQPPVDLTTLNAYYEGGIETFPGPIRDTMGNTYQSGIRGYNPPNSENCFHIWDIGRAYDTLTATVIIRETDKGSPYEASFKIYGDGVLLYEMNHITSLLKPTPITVDIRGVTDLKIEMYGYGLFTPINAVLVDVMLHRS